MKVAVLGLGPMGRGIARVFERAGAAVVVVDADEELTRRGFEQLEREAADDGETTAVAAATLESSVAHADLLVEAIAEDMDAKRQLLQRVAGMAGDDLIVASNTSSLSIGELGRAFGDPARVGGAHFFNPPTKMRLVEVVRGPLTDASTVDALVEWCRRAGKTPVVCDDAPNFIVNRICRPLYTEAQLLLTQGVPTAAVDAVARQVLGHRMGPLELLDFAGLHVHLASSETALREFGDPRYRPIPIVRRLVRAGLTGRGAGRGFYDYSGERPRDAQQRLIVEPPSGGSGVNVTGPGASRLLARFPGVQGDGTVTLYACGERATAADAEAVTALEGDVVVASSDGLWVDALPSGAGWLALHEGRERPFAEVVVDSVARITRTSGLDAVLGRLGAASVELPALGGLVADRLRFTLVNEAASLLEEGLADEEAIDTAMRLGMNHPEGPFEYLRRTGARPVVGGLRALAEHFGEPRYRPAQILCRQAGGERR